MPLKFIFKTSKRHELDDQAERLRPLLDADREPSFTSESFFDNSANEHHDDDDTPQIPIALNIFYVLIWLTAFTIFGYYMGLIITQYKDSVANPRSSVRIVKEEEMQYPKVTLCNFNHVDKNSTSACTFCYLYLEDCFMLEGADQFNRENCKRHMRKIEIESKLGTSHCYQFNYNHHHPMIAKHTGYSQAVNMIFAIPIVKRSLDYRVGMQVSFDEIEEEPDTYEENRFAPPGASPSKLDDAAASLTVHPAVETFYSLREVVTVYKDEFERDINHTVTYETRSTFLSLDNPNNATHAFVGVAFGFQKLEKQEIEFVPEYKLENFFGDFAAILGLLTGLDVVKLMTSIPLCYDAIRHKSLYHLREHFL